MLMQLWTEFVLDGINSGSTHTHNHFTDLWILSGTTRVSWYQKKHSPTHTYRGHQSSFICFIHLLLSMASSLFSPHAWQSFSTISVQVIFGLPFGLAPSTSYSIHFFTQSLSSFCNTCQYHHNLFRCSTKIMSSNPGLSLSLNALLGTLSCSFMPHIHLTNLISACWCATSFSFLTSQFSLPCNILLRTQLLYNFPLTITDISLLVSNRLVAEMIQATGDIGTQWILDLCNGIVKEDCIPHTQQQIRAMCPCTYAETGH